MQFPIGQWVIILDFRASMGAVCGKEEGENFIRTETNLGVEKLSQASPSSLCFLALDVPGLAGDSCQFQPFSSVEKQLRGSWTLWQLRLREERPGSIAGSAVESVTFPVRGDWKYMVLSLMKSEGGTRHGGGC